MNRHARFLYQPVCPLGRGGRMVTGSNAHWAISLRAAEEGTVLLKNDGTLPLPRGAKVSLFGTGAGDFLFGGGGSGRVYSNRLISLHDALTDAAKRGEISYFAETAEYAQAELARRMESGEAHADSGSASMPELPEALYRRAVPFGGTAIFCVSRYSREGDQGGDRLGGKGDFDLQDGERELLARLCKDFAHVVVVLNVCGPVSVTEYRDEKKVGALLYSLYGGGMAGTALVNLLLGKAAPGGRLQHTLAEKLTDWPSTADFSAYEDHVDYTEDIFVGYRWFETFAPEKVVYPFGFGLTYTTFAVSCQSAARRGHTVTVKAAVQNTGKRAGREVVQLYLSAPQGKLGKAARVLCAFAKTRTLALNEVQTVTLRFDLRDFASYDDLGKLQKDCFVLERGEYAVLLGNNVREAAECFRFELKNDEITLRCNNYMAPRALAKRLTASGEYEPLPAAKPKKHKPVGYTLTAEPSEKPLTFAEALAEDRLDEFMTTLTPRDLAELLYGHPIMNPSNTNGIGVPPRYEREDKRLIPLVPTADGPAGLRIREGRGVSPTFFPCESVMAQTWDPALIAKEGAAVARESRENNIGIWLSPGVNLHRSPLTGRNFEYYSEDPLCAGRCAAAVIRGTQSEKVGATIKHFCCNNREQWRRVADSRVSKRALRELYLKPFEIAVKEADPWLLMTAYNPVNGVHMSANWEAITGILRGEWGYRGLVITDWRTYENIEDELAAGNDVKMPELVSRFTRGLHFDAAKQYDLEDLIAKGKLDRSMVLASARRVLQMMDHFD